MSAAQLEAFDLQHSFHETRVVDQVSVTLRPGHLAVVLGPNGSGKTTLLRILSGVLRPAKGNVALAGQPIEKLSRREVARKLAVVPQDTQVPFPFLAREIVAMGRAPSLGPLGRESASDERIVDDALASLGVTELADRSFPTLSGGEKQRVVLARALAQRTDLMLLDEPTAHMDLGHRVHTFEWLTAWIAAAPDIRAALVVTHDLTLAARYADEVLLMHAGRLVAQGSAAEVLTRERIAEVYRVQVQIEHDDQGRPYVIAVRSEIG